MIHTVKGFGVFNKAEIDVFLELSCFFYDPTDASNLENSVVATGLEKVIFIPVPKKGNAKECSDYCTIALISHASKVMFKIL